MGRFSSPGQVQRFLSVHEHTAALFRPKRHHFSARSYRHIREEAFANRREHSHELVA